MARLGKEHLGGMSTEGQRVRERRERLGLDKKALAEHARVNRNTLAAIEAGESFNRTSLAKIERALDELERETGIDAPSPAPVESTDEGLVEFEVDGSRVVVRGPISNADELARMVARLIRETREDETDESD